MVNKITVIIALIIMLLHTTTTYAEGFKYVEIFDPQQNKVVKVVQLNKELNHMVSNWITNLDGIYGKNDPCTDDGYALRIPLDPSVKIDKKFFKATVNEVFIIIPKKEPPFFMIFENEDKLCAFPFNGDIDMLSKALDFKLK